MNEPTEAGKRLNDVMGGDCADLIAAIEAEAYDKGHADGLLAAFERWDKETRAIERAAERARIAEAVDALEDPWPVPGSRDEVPRDDWCRKRDVLALLEPTDE